VPSATFYSLDDGRRLLPSHRYRLTFSMEAQQLTLEILNEQESNEQTNWLQFVLHKKVHTWIENCVDADEKRLDSHHLIDPEEFSKTYVRLKQKYGTAMENIWITESTDPKKYVYEDVSIASYLIVLWQQERAATGCEMQSFADLGCGNGLLVFILQQEGHRGYGIDLRRRKVWDKFPAKVDLREEPIVPTDGKLFGDVDWLIGNHSDELSPWIAVLAAKSAISSKYFLLPCCAFEFSGAKFQRTDTKKSIYMGFIDYLMEISELCGFRNTKIDRLKIPSTKRICLIGDVRIYEDVESFKAQNEKLQTFIDNSISCSEFKPRDKIQIIRNCTLVDRKLKESIVERIFNRLISLEPSFVDRYANWNCGGKLTMPEAVEMIAADELQQLKQECGGLQTLLKNKHQVFEVVQGIIKIRVPKKLLERKIDKKNLARNVIKSTYCYFFNNHPQQCPLQESDCSYVHELAQ